jgi:hypothetical protein
MPKFSSRRKVGQGETAVEGGGEVGGVAGEGDGVGSVAAVALGAVTLVGATVERVDVRWIGAGVAVAGGAGSAVSAQATSASATRMASQASPGIAGKARRGLRATVGCLALLRPGSPDPGRAEWARPSSLRTVGLLSNSRRAGSADLWPRKVNLGHPIDIAVFGDGDLDDVRPSLAVDGMWHAIPFPAGFQPDHGHVILAERHIG